MSSDQWPFLENCLFSFMWPQDRLPGCVCIMLRPPQTFVSWVQLTSQGLYDTSGPIKFLPSEQNIDTGVQSKLLDTREKYSELWHDGAFLPRDLGRRGENSEAGAEMREEQRRNCCPYGEWPSAESPLQPLGPLWHPNSL